MAIGLKHSDAQTGEQEKDRIYILVREFIRRFKERNGTIICRELLKCDISTPEGLKNAQEQNLFANVCQMLIRDAAEITEQII